MKVVWEPWVIIDKCGLFSLLFISDVDLADGTGELTVICREQFIFHSSPRRLAGEKKSYSYNHKTTIWVSHEYYLNPEFHKILSGAF